MKGEARSVRRRLAAHLLMRDGDKCAVCSAPLTGGIRDLTGMGLQIDHIIPRYHGVNEGLENKQLLHAACNNHKGREWGDSERAHVERNRFYYEGLLSRPNLIDPACMIWADSDA